MKCDELKPIKQGSVELGEYWVYYADGVDAAIAELKAQVNGFRNRANLWHYNAQNEHNEAVAVRIENAKLKAKLAEKDKEIAELKEQYKDMDVTHTVHIAKMNAKIEELESKNAQLEDDVAFWKKKLSSCLNGDCILTCDTVEKYGKENVRLKRAMWLARAERAHLKVLEYWPDYCHNAHCRIAEQKWDKVERKCRAMAEKWR